MAMPNFLSKLHSFFKYQNSNQTHFISLLKIWNGPTLEYYLTWPIFFMLDSSCLPLYFLAKLAYKCLLQNMNPVLVFLNKQQRKWESEVILHRRAPTETNVIAMTAMILSSNNNNNENEKGENYWQKQKLPSNQMFLLKH
jgi:hypothetical protein